jgi:hypothetical protein
VSLEINGTGKQLRLLLTKFARSAKPERGSARFARGSAKISGILADSSGIFAEPQNLNYNFCYFLLICKNLKFKI